MTRFLYALLPRFGQKIWLRGEPLWAFLQPLRDKNETVPSGMSPLGWLDARRWLYLGTACLREGDCVDWNGLRLRTVSGRAVFFGGRFCYWRAVLVNSGEEAEG